MASRRMFSRELISSDSFIELSFAAQALYLHFGTEADDDGFLKNPKGLMRMIGCERANLDELIKNKFVIEFASGVIVIRHWLQNNSIRKDRYQPSKCKEKNSLSINENEVYNLDTDGCHMVANLDTDGCHSIDKDSIDKDSIDKDTVNGTSYPYQEIIDYLNLVCGTNYRSSTKDTRDLIRARMKEGFTLEDFYTVIDKKSREWLNDAEFCKCLRPKTLFSNKFESYLNQIEKLSNQRGSVINEDGVIVEDENDKYGGWL